MKGWKDRGEKRDTAGDGTGGRGGRVGRGFPGISRLLFAGRFVRLETNCGDGVSLTTARTGQRKGDECETELTLSLTETTFLFQLQRLTGVKKASVPRYHPSLKSLPLKTARNRPLGAQSSTSYAKQDCLEGVFLGKNSVLVRTIRRVNPLSFHSPLAWADG